MGCGRPKKKVAMTPPESVRVFSSTPNSSGKGPTGNNVNSDTKLMETIVEELIGEGKPEERDSDDTKTPQLWVDIIKGNHLPSNGNELSYTAPLIVDGEIEVQLEEKDVASKMIF